VKYEPDFLRVAEKGCVSSEVRTYFLIVWQRSSVFPVRYEMDFLSVAQKECVSSDVRT
jgi:hypothetical protein